METLGCQVVPWAVPSLGMQAGSVSAGVGNHDREGAMQRLALLNSITDQPPTDGRVARGERTRVKVADALISLLEEGETAPTAKMVAQRAGVSLRLVFHHFEDMDSLYRAVMVLQAQRYWARLRDVPPELPLSHRVDRTVRQRGRLYDAIGPVRRAAVPLASRSEDLAQALAESSSLLRGRLELTFGPELEAAGADAGDLFEAIDVAASWEVWERLRLGQQLSAVAARRVMARTLAALLAPGSGEIADGADSGPRRPRRRAAMSDRRASPGELARRPGRR
jgi:TetR/AcrR family transcriptional regulator, regulator of autoinduction and epiphytic fitness